MVITIDGPAGAGKSTVARRLAMRLGYRYLDTGAMYRAVAWKALAAGVDPGDEGAATAVAARLQLDVSPDPSSTAILVNGTDPGPALRTPPVSAAASTVAAHAGVRRALVARQRAIAAGGHWVVEGRDMGTAVFPTSPCKIYLDASPEARAARRVAQSGVTETPEAMAERDRRDAGRTTDPLRPAPDAFRCDSTGLGVDEVVDRIVRYVDQCKEERA